MTTPTATPTPDSTGAGQRPGLSLHSMRSAWARRRAALAASPERGDLSMWLIMTVAIAFLLCMLLVDGSAKRQAGIQAHWYAAEAARAGANAAGPRSDGVASADAAATAARAYLARAGVSGSVIVQSPSSVRVTATASRVGPMSHKTFTATETATADLLVGVETGQRP